MRDAVASTAMVANDPKRSSKGLKSRSAVRLERRDLMHAAVSSETSAVMSRH
jgi:hypothetical protein